MTVNVLPPEVTRAPNLPSRGPRQITWPTFPVGSSIEKALEPLKTEHARLGADLRAIRLQLDAAQQSRIKAAREDNAAYSAAIRNGEKDPGAQATAAVEAALVEARRKGNAIVTARAAIEREVEDVLRQHGDEYRQEALATVEEQRAGATELLDALEGAVQGMQAAKALGFWVTNPHRAPAGPTPYLDGLRNTANEPINATQVIAALEAWLAGEVGR